MCLLSLDGLALAGSTDADPRLEGAGEGKMRRSWSATVSRVAIFTMAAGFGIAGAQVSLAARDTQRPPASATPEPNAAQPAGDQDFVSQAAMSNMVAIQLGHMAAKKAQHAEVQRFAQATIDDYLKAQQQLADAAYGAGVRWPTKLDERYHQIQQRLSKLGNDQFDREVHESDDRSAPRCREHARCTCEQRRQRQRQSANASDRRCAFRRAHTRCEGESMGVNGIAGGPSSPQGGRARVR